MRLPPDISRFRKEIKTLSALRTLFATASFLAPNHGQHFLPLLNEAYLSH